MHDIGCQECVCSSRLVLTALLQLFQLSLSFYLSNLTALITTHQTLFLAIGGRSAAIDPSNCKASCQSIRSNSLNDISSSVCLKASNLSPIPKLFQSCIDGRKKGFDQCVYMCLNGSHATDSFDGCKASEGHSARTNMMQVSI